RGPAGRTARFATRADAVQFLDLDRLPGRREVDAARRQGDARPFGLLHRLVEDPGLGADRQHERDRERRLGAQRRLRFQRRVLAYPRPDARRDAGLHGRGAHQRHTVDRRGEGRAAAARAAVERFADRRLLAAAHWPVDRLHRRRLPLHRLALLGRRGLDQSGHDRAAGHEGGRDERRRPAPGRAHQRPDADAVRQEPVRRARLHPAGVLLLRCDRGPHRHQGAGAAAAHHRREHRQVVLTRMQLEVTAESWAYATPFRITSFVFTAADVLCVTLSDGGHVGRGEAAGVYYHGETPASMAAQVEAVRGAVEAGVGREALRALLPPGGARNALDAALWDLEAKRRGEPAWRIAGEAAPRALRTTFTV